MHANKARLPYDEHEIALKVIHALDRRVWEVKILTIIKSPNYTTFTMVVLFSKLNSTKIDHQTRVKIENPSAPTMALVSRGGSFCNPSLAMFSLSSLLAITKEQVESLEDEELALVASWFTQFPSNRQNRWPSGLKDGCFNYSGHHSGCRKGKQ
jgi:hypothetical protein